MTDKLRRDDQIVCAATIPPCLLMTTTSLISSNIELSHYKTLQYFILHLNLACLKIKCECNYHSLSLKTLLNSPLYVMKEQNSVCDNN